MKQSAALLLITLIMLRCHGGGGPSKPKFQRLEEVVEIGSEQKADDEMSESARAFARAHPLHYAAAANNVEQVRQALREGRNTAETVPFLVPFDSISETFLRDEAGRILPPEMPEGEDSHGSFHPLAFAALYDSVEAAEELLGFEEYSIEVLVNVFEIAVQADSKSFTTMLTRSFGAA